jgi:hypothetical protein
MEDNNLDQTGTTPSATPQPPSKEDLLEAVMAVIVDLFGGTDEDRRANVKHHLTDSSPTSYRDDLKEITELYYSDFPEVDSLAIVKEQAEKWKAEKGELEFFDWRNWDVIPEFIHKRFREALRDRYSSYNEDFWRVIKPGLSCLKNYRAYPFDEKLDRGLLERAAEQFPDIDIKRQIYRKINWWEEHPNALSAAKSPRAQLWDFFEGEVRFREKKAHERDRIGQI